MNAQDSVAFAEKFLRDMLSFYGVNAAIETEVKQDIIHLVVPDSDDNSILIGRNAETLRAFQYMLSTALRNKDAELVRVNVDIAGYKAQRAEKVAEKARMWVADVLETGEPHRAHINAADRRIVHQVVVDNEGVQSHSEGEGRDRCIVISKAE